MVETAQKQFRYSWRWVFYFSAPLVILFAYCALHTMASYLLLLLLIMLPAIELFKFFKWKIRIDSDGIKIGSGLFAKTLHWRDIKTIEYKYAQRRVAFVTHYDEIVPDASADAKFMDRNSLALKVRRFWRKWQHTHKINPLLTDFDEFLDELKRMANEYLSDAEGLSDPELHRPNADAGIDITIPEKITLWTRAKVYLEQVAQVLGVFFWLGMFLGLEAYTWSIKAELDPIEHAIRARYKAKVEKLCQIPDDKNAARLINAAVESLRGLNGESYLNFLEYSEKPYSDKDIKWAENVVVQNKHVIPLLDDALSRKQACFVDPYRDEKYLVMALAQVRELVRFLKLRANVALHNNQPEIAIDSMNRIFDISYVARDDVRYIQALSRQSMVGVALRIFKHLVEEEFMTTETLVSLEQKVNRELGTLSVKKYIELFRYDEIMFFENPVAEEQLPTWFWIMSIGDTRPLIPPIATLLFFNSHLKTLKIIDEIEMLAKTNPNYYDSIAIEAVVLREYHNNFLPTFSLSFPYYGHRVNYVNLTALRSTLGVIAIERFRLQTGQLPKDITELEDVLGREFPDDPFSKTKLLYEKTKNGYRVYSAAIKKALKQGEEITNSQDKKMLFEVRVNQKAVQ